MASLRTVVLSAMVLAGAGDSSINAAGIYMKIQGQSGKMTFATSEPIGSADDKVQIDMAKMEELADDGTVLGAGGNSKHSFNSFATQEFTFGTPEETTIRGVSNGTDSPKDFAITKVSFKSYFGGGDPDLDSELSVDAIIFQEDALLRFKGEDGKNIDQAAPKGTVKFNVRMKQWNWCNNDCKSQNGVGSSVRLTIEMTTQIDPDKEANIQPLSGCSNGECKNGDVQDLGGLSLAVLDTYSIKDANGISTEYKMPVAPTLSISPEPGTASGGSRTTTMVFEFPKANFGDLDELIYDPMMSYDGFSTEATTTTATATTTFEDGSSTSSEGGDSDGSSTSSEGSGGDVNSTTDESEPNHAAGISVVFNVMFSLLAWLYLYTV